MASMMNKNQDIKAALERYSKDELVDLMDHILRIYVLNESVKLDTKLSKPETIRELAGLSFAQLLTTLQNSLELDELTQFRVTPYTVYVRIGDIELDLNGPSPILGREKQEESAQMGESQAAEEDEEDMSPAERMDAMDNKPWRTTYKAPKPIVSKVQTPSMAELFANDKPGERGFSLSMEPPTLAEEEDVPPIAQVAPGDDPAVAPNAGGSQDFAKTAQNREEQVAAAPPPALAEGDKQINPSNRFASLDLD